jgi:hypothetical protein
MVELFLCVLVAAQKPTIKAEKTVEPYRLVRLQAENVPAKAGIIWRVRPDKGVDRSSQPDKNKLEFVAPPGSYLVEILVVTVAADGQVNLDETTTTVVIGSKQPEPPQPVDPDVPPQPDSQLAKDIKSAWQANTDPSKDKHAKALASLFRQAPTVMDKVQTAGQLYQTLKASADILLPDKQAISKIRELIADQLKSILPTDPALVLSDTNKLQAKSVFSEIATILEGLK